MKVQEYNWERRTIACRHFAEKMARKLQSDRRISRGKFDFQSIADDAELYLRMGYQPHEVTLMECSDGAAAVYRLYPKSAKKLKGRKRA